MTLTCTEWIGTEVYSTLVVGSFTIEVWRQGGGWLWDVTIGESTLVARGRSGDECATYEAAKSASVAALRKVLEDAIRRLAEVQP